ncbi:MAG: hypothetical protein IH898_11475 [Planctomycetes bacterium]|nr:hypothetical protein [Planctomycetota bacterium]
MKPVLQALLVADHVYDDKVTNKKVVAGIFHDMYFLRREEVQQVDLESGKAKIVIPPGGMKAGSPFSYISLTDVRGKQEFDLRYVRLRDDKTIFESHFQVDCPDPLATVEVMLPLPPLPADQPGIYALELLWNQEPLGSYRIAVREMKERETEDE